MLVAVGCPGSPVLWLLLSSLSFTVFPALALLVAGDPYIYALLQGLWVGSAKHRLPQNQ